MTKKWWLMVMFLAITLGCNHMDTPVDKDKLLGDDYRLFQGTSLWNLAKAVEKEDTAGIREMITHGENPNLGEPRFGGTLLMMAINNDNYPSVLSLLKNGADPNQGDAYRGTTAMHYAAENDDIKYLRLLLNYHGNPNAIEHKETGPGGGISRTVLNSAIRLSLKNSLEKVVLLVDAGADVDGVSFNEKVRSPISESIIVNKMDVLLFLLHRGADYKKVIYKMANGHDVYILEALRNCILDLQSPDYVKKEQVVTFLKAKGLDYHREPIPNEVLKRIEKKYPESWKDYISKY